MNYITIEVTFTSKKEARDLSQKLLDNKLVADSQLSKVYSLFNWEGKFYSRPEFKIAMKTRENLFSEIEEYIKKNHSFKCPQIVAAPLIHGSREYFDWIDENIEINKFD